jgi:hypothetical protein
MFNDREIHPGDKEYPIAGVPLLYGKWSWVSPSQDNPDEDQRWEVDLESTDYDQNYKFEGLTIKLDVESINTRNNVSLPSMKYNIFETFDDIKSEAQIESKSVVIPIKVEIPTPQIETVQKPPSAPAKVDNEQTRAFESLRDQVAELRQQLALAHEEKVKHLKSSIKTLKDPVKKIESVQKLKVKSAKQVAHELNLETQRNEKEKIKKERAEKAKMEAWVVKEKFDKLDAADREVIIAARKLKHANLSDSEYMKFMDSAKKFHGDKFTPSVRYLNLLDAPKKLEALVKGSTPIHTKRIRDHTGQATGETTAQLLNTAVGILMNQHVYDHCSHFVIPGIKDNSPIPKTEIIHRNVFKNKDIILCKRFHGCPDGLAKKYFEVPSVGCKVYFTKLDDSMVDGLLTSMDVSGSYGLQGTVSLSTKPGDCGGAYVNENSCVVAMHWSAGQKGVNNLCATVDNDFLALFDTNLNKSKN